MDDIAALTARINAHKKLRVWSLIITFFGDSIEPRGGAVSAKTVQEVLGQMGIEQGTVRTAFSRLCSDGWITREKHGRESFYTLEKSGLQLFVDAAIKIYAPVQRVSSSHTKLILAVDQKGEVALHRNPDDLKLAELKAQNHLLTSGDLLACPGWFLEKLAPQSLADEYRRLMANFQPLHECELEPLEQVSARCLLVHEWRRIILQSGYLEPELQPVNWPQQECHKFVAHLYHQWSPKANEWLATKGSGPAGGLMPPAKTFFQRFI